MKLRICIKSFNQTYNIKKYLDVFMEEHRQTGAHKCSMTNRKNIVLTGILDVASFDEEEIVLLTTSGTLEVCGKELKVKNINVETGDALVNGTINSLTYSDKKYKKRDRQSFFARFFS